MALSVIKRPEGYVLSTTENTATASSSSGVLFTDVAHGLTTGDYVYVYSDVSALNGYWYVSVVDPDSFRIREYPTATDQAYTDTATYVRYFRSTRTHYYSCVHLPIVYKLKSDIWPINGVDTARTITTFSDYGGYTYIVAAGDIKSSGEASSLEQVILTGTSVDGVYQIIQWFSETNFTIDLAYSAGNVLSTGTVQYYYYNYHARVQLWASALGGSTQSQVAELKCVPDSSGIITLNIAEYLKSRVGILENDPLQYNINRYGSCSFYIQYAESYDDSNMYTISEYVGSYTNDSSQFTGRAVNSILPFKTRSSGFMSEYLDGYTSTNRAKFLTNFTSPVLTPNKYFDLSYLASGSQTLRRTVYVDGVLKDVFNTSAGVGGTDAVNRSEIQRSGWSEDRIDVTIYNDRTVTASVSGTSSQIQTLPCFLGTGETPTGTYSYQLTIAGASASAASVAITYQPSGQVIYTQTITTSTTAGGSANLPAATTGSEYIRISVSTNLGGAFVCTAQGTATVTEPMTETLTINVDEDCSDQDFYLTWLNNLGGFDYWNFKARKVYSVDVSGNTVVKKDTFTNWPKSYGEFADTILQQTSRTSNEVIKVSSQLLTVEQEAAIKKILSSPLVQEVTSKYDRRAVIIDPSTYRTKKDKDDTRSISFELRYTDDIPSQAL